MRRRLGSRASTRFALTPKTSPLTSLWTVLDHGTFRLRTGCTVGGAIRTMIHNMQCPTIPCALEPLGPTGTNDVMRRPIAWLAAVTMVAGSPTVADTIPHETVRLASGTSGTTPAGQVKCYDRVQHAMGVTMGQKLDVQLDSGNSSLYFTLTALVPALRRASCFQSRARLSPTRPRAGRTKPRPDAADRRAIPWRPRSSASGK